MLCTVLPVNSNSTNLPLSYRNSTGSLPDASFVESLNLDQQVKDAWGKAAEFSELELLADVADISRKNEGERRHPFLRARSSSTLGKDAYAKALRANILASGDTCSRAVLRPGCG